MKDSQLLLLWNGFWGTRDGKVNIETWYFKITLDNKYLLLKEELFLKSKLNLYTNQKFHFQFYDL